MKAIKFLDKIRSNLFLRNVFILVLGTGFGQIISILASPILTRVYSPDAFGVYGVFTSLVSIGMIFATCRFEQELVLTRSKSERHGILTLIFSIIILIIIITFILAKIFSRIISLDSPIHFVLKYWTILLAITIGLSGLQFTLRFLCLKEKAFKLLSTIQIIHILTVVGIQITFGILSKGGAINLAIGMMTGLIVNVLFVGIIAFRKKWIDFQKYLFSFKRIIIVVKKNVIYPKYFTWSSLCNSAVPEAPILINSFFFAKDQLGQFFLALRVVKLPFILISQSISQVNFQEGSTISVKQLKNIYINRTKKISLLSSLPFIILFLWAPSLFVFVFGKQWHEAGILTRLILPGIYIQFIFTPFTSYFTILQELKIYLGWAITRLILISFGLLLGALIFGLRASALGYSFAMGINFLLHHFILLKLLKVHNQNMDNKI